jgi:AcrR family transcriptional regulator
MSTSSGRPTPAQTSRDRILDAAIRRFARQGYGSTPIRQIAQDAQVATGLIHYHFQDKEGLLTALFQRSLAQVQASLDEADAASDLDPLQGLDQLVRTAFASVARDQDFWRLSYQLRMQADAVEALGGALQLWAEETRERIEVLLRASRHPNPSPAAHVLFAAIDGAAQHFVLDPDNYPLDPVARSLVAHFAAPGAAAGP